MVFGEKKKKKRDPYGDKSFAINSLNDTFSMIEK